MVAARNGVLRVRGVPAATVRRRFLRRVTLTVCLFCLVAEWSAAGDAHPRTEAAASFALAIVPVNLSQGDTVTYTITAVGAGLQRSAAFDVGQAGGVADRDFDRPLAGAIAAAATGNDIGFDGHKRLTFPAGFAGTLSFSRTLVASPPDGAVHVVRLSAPRGASLMQPTAVALVGTPSLPRYPAMVRGANVSGGEFGRVPGTYATDYIYPGREQIDFYASRGFSVLRVPFRWQRVQHTLYGGLDVVGDGSGDFERLRKLVGTITGRGMVAVLDPHDYGGRNVGSQGVLIGSAALPVAAFDDLWRRLAQTFKGNERVWFNLMNEPAGISASRWKMIAQSATNAIRATGALNRILVPGTAWTGAHSWVSSGNAAQMTSFVDPAHNYAFDVHQYLDRDSSGSQGTCVTGAGAKRLNAFIVWARAAPNRSGFLGEFAGGDPAVPGRQGCATELRALLDSAERSGVFVGWTAWGGGPWWNKAYMFRLQPAGRGGGDTSYMHILRSYVR
jgi:endoglucanase